VIKNYSNIVTVSFCNTTCLAIASFWNLHDILKPHVYRASWR